MKRSSSTCRLRKCSCPDCGYTVRVTRSWMNEGLPICPKHGEMLPESPADLAYIGRIGPDDMSLGAWNSIARELGWPIILNQGQAAQAAKRGKMPVDVQIKPQCSYAGCGRWTAGAAEFCSEHSADRELELAPF